MKTWVLAALALLGLCFFTDIPDRIVDGWPAIEEVADEISAAVHVVAFLGLTLFVLAARWPFRPVIALLALLGLAGGTELAQLIVPQRMSDLGDFFLDLGGIVVGAGIWWGMVSSPSARTPGPALPEPETIPLPQPAASRRKAA